MELFHKMISAALNISEKQINNTLNLLKDGATIPFISRYRKEVTGGLDEVQIENIKNQYDKLCETAKRKETILSTISEQGKLTAELQKRIDDTWDTTELEDIYLPYKPKRKTRAEAARQKGLEPLAVTLMLQRENNLEAKVGSFVKGDVKTIEDALKGARDIIAEQVNEDERARNAIRNQFSRRVPDMNEKLVYHWPDFTVRKQVFEIINEEVRNTDCFHLARCISVLKRFPNLYVFFKIALVIAPFRPRLRTVYQHKIDIW